MRLGLLYLRTEDYKPAPVMVPNALTYLASYLERKLNYKDCIVDISLNNILEQKPDILGISSFTESFTEVSEISAYVKEKLKIPVIVGGPHISAIPDTLPETVDIGVMDEGEETIVELMKLFLENKVSPENLSMINGLVFHDHENGTKIKTVRRAWMDDIDNIPAPDRTILNNIGKPLEQALFTSRGCPFKCTFCTAGEFWEKVRYHSTDRVIQEIFDIIRVAPDQKHIAITDDLFAMSKKRLKTIGDAIRSEGIHKKVFFSCNARASVFDDEIAQLLFDMNVRIVALGIESANEHVLKFLKGHARAAQNQKAIDLCHQYGLFPLTHFLIGSKIETPAAAADTYWFIRHNWQKITKLDSFSAIPFPGTPFWKDALDRRLVPDHFTDWGIMNLKFEPGKSIYLNTHSSPEEFEFIINQFHEVSKKKDSLESEFQRKIASENYYKGLLTQSAAFTAPDSSFLEISNYRENITAFSANSLYHEKYPDTSFKTVKKFDQILMLHTLEKTVNPSEALIKIKDQLSENGRLILTIYNSQSISYLMYLLTDKIDKELPGIFDNTNLSFFTLQSVKKLLANTGFELLNYFKNPMLVNKENINSYNTLKGLFLESGIINQGFDYDIFSYILIAQKIKEIN